MFAWRVDFGERGAWADSGWRWGMQLSGRVTKREGGGCRVGRVPCLTGRQQSPEPLRPMAANGAMAPRALRPKRGCGWMRQNSKPLPAGHAASRHCGAPKTGRTSKNQCRVYSENVLSAETTAPATSACNQCSPIATGCGGTLHIERKPRLLMRALGSSPTLQRAY